jgi:hypothetical protein
MKRVIGYAVVLAVAIGLVWAGSLRRSGGEQSYQGRLDNQFCMDANGDGGVDISDAVGILSHLFLGSTPAGSCVAQGFSPDERFVNEGQADAITPGMVQAGYYGRLDAGLLDGKDGADFALVAHTHPETSDEINSLKQRVSELEGALRDVLPHLSVVELADGKGGMRKTIRFSGVNVQVVNGSGTTDTTNGVGNLIVGYNETRGQAEVDDRSGSHNLIVGVSNNCSSFGGVVFGGWNTISGPLCSITGGGMNQATETGASVHGGLQNLATGIQSSVSGGHLNVAAGLQAVVAGGRENTAGGEAAAVGGGKSNTASGDLSSVEGGERNVAIGSRSCVIAGVGNTASGILSTVIGASSSEATGSSSCVSGGDLNHAIGDSSYVSGGQKNKAEGYFSTVSGGIGNTMILQGSVLCGGREYMDKLNGYNPCTHDPSCP